jgi:DNA sulfur modification protein DndD
VYSDLHRLFDRGVGAYREQLRRRVEADATKHFKALTTEPDYASLRINDSYGLSIVHEDGSDIPVRSAGAEHVVALCLIGALQNNAPLRGPIVIDSPFGRLDRDHTRNIVKALPSMTKQVVLLVYDDELPPDLARTELKNKLRGEWRLERRSARHTELVPRKD